MRTSLIEKGIPALWAAVGLAALSLWVRGFLAYPLPPERSFGLDRPIAAAVIAPPLRPASVAFYKPGTPVPSLPGDWPGFRGPDRANVSAESVPLARSWPAQGPRVLWSANLGEGYAAPAVHKGRVYVLDYDQPAQADSLRCFALADGAEIWRCTYPQAVKRNHGMSRTVPAANDRYVVSLGPKCHVLCADALTGAVKWEKDLTGEFGTVVPDWYAGQCPLIDGGRVILATGGSALLVAFDLATGKVAWRSPNPRGWQMTHSSIMPISFAGKRIYVYCGSGGVAGIDANDGATLWDTTDWVISTATVPTPVPVSGGRIFLTGGYDSGAMMVQQQESGGKISVRTVFRVPPTVCGSEQQTPILYQDHLYAVVTGGELVCLDLAGKRIWSSGTQHRFGMGPFLIAQGTIYLMSDNGLLTLAEASPAGYRQLAEARVLEGPEAWGPLALAGGRLLARDTTHMVCLDVAAH